MICAHSPGAFWVPRLLQTQAAPCPRYRPPSLASLSPVTAQVLQYGGLRARCWSLFLNLMTKMDISRKISCRAFLPSTGWSVCSYSSALISHRDPSCRTLEQISALEMGLWLRGWSSRPLPYVCVCVCVHMHVRSMGRE